jgi:hypothetical protein
MAELARAAGQDGLAARLDRAAKAMGDFQDAAKADAAAGLELALGSLAATGEEVKGTLIAAGEAMEMLDKGGELLTVGLDKVSEKAEKAKGKVRDLSKEMSRSRPKTGAAETEEFVAQQLAIIATQRELVSAQDAGNATLAANLQLQLATQQAELARLQTKNQEIGAASELLALETAQLAQRQQLAALAAQDARTEGAARLLTLQQQRLEAETRLDALGAARLERQAAELAAQEAFAASQRTSADFAALRLANYEAQLVYEQQLAELETARLEREIAGYVQAGNVFRSAVSGLDAGPAVAALAEIGGGVDTLIQQYHDLRAAGVSANEAMAQSAGSATGAIGAAIAKQIKDTRRASAVRGAFAAAEAGIYYASGNIPSGIAATAAAVAHFAVAAGAGSGAASGPVQPGGAQQTERLGSSGERLDDVQRRQARYTAEALGEAQGASTIQINYNLAGAVLLEDSVTTQRRLTEAVRADLERTGVSLGGR